MLKRLLFVFTCLTVACASGADESDAAGPSSQTAASSAPRICNPGDLQRCAGANGCDGVRECNRSGSGYGVCLCEDSGGASASMSRVRSVPAAAGSGAPSSPAVEPPDLREALYAQPEPQECEVDADCPGGCCVQIGVSLRQCEGDSHCTLHWITPAPKTIPQWQLSDFAGYTGSFAADVVHSRIAEVLDSDGRTILKLENQQYWLNYSSVGATPVVGDECWVVPGRSLYNMYLSQADQPLGVSQIPVVLDTSVVGSDGRLTTHGVYELQGAGYWRVFSESRSTGRRVLLASPNNVNYWIFTEGRSDNPVDPVLVRADSRVTRSEADGFVLANGQAWAYFASGPLQSEAPAVGDHAIVYQQALVSDDDPDLPILDTTWVEGKSMGGLMLVVPAL